MSTIDRFSSYISENTHSISREVVDFVVSQSNQEISEDEKNMAVSMYTGLLGFFSDSLNNENAGVIPEHLIDWSKNNAQMLVEHGGNLSDIVIRYPLTRDIFSEIMLRISLDINLSTTDTANMIKAINRVLDVSLNETVLAFELLSDQKNAELKKELVSLSAPIVPIRDEIVVVPLIGYFDEERTTYIMETTIPKIASMEVDFVIMDFSGTLTINSHVAESLQQIGSMLKLMGIQVVVTGLRPELVQVAVNSNIRISSAYVFSTVKQALNTIG